MKLRTRPLIVLFLTALFVAMPIFGEKASEAEHSVEMPLELFQGDDIQRLMDCDESDLAEFEELMSVLADELKLPQLEELADNIAENVTDIMPDDPVEVDNSDQTILAANNTASFPAFAMPSGGQFPTAFAPPSLPVISKNPVAMPVANKAFESKTQIYSVKQPSTNGPETLEFSEDEIGLRGNWVKKKEWLKQAKETEIELISVCEKIHENRKSIYNGKFEKADNLLDDFYRDAGVRRGNLTALLESIEHQVKDQVDRLMDMTRGFRDVGEDIKFQLYEIEEKAAKYKDDLEQIKLDIESVADLDTSVAVRIEAIDGYIKAADKEKVEANKTVALMFSIVDHEKARQKYYEVKGMYERVNAIGNYVEKTAASDFNSLVGTLETQVKKIQDQLSSVRCESDGMRAKLDDALRPKRVVVQAEGGEKTTKAKRPWYKRIFLWGFE